ncbi:oxygenase MpaB family protein [Streptomyces sp. NPDC005435]|uniref:oxygenase MpaB family protein n=1 Tax=Streptomyces sp. NPDC005435 TaxID=3154464 RepID=UPI0034540DE1
MTTTSDAVRPPGRLVGFEAARSRHGGRADHMAAMLQEGDPLADAVIAELDVLGVEGRRALSQGLAGGLASLDSPPPAVAALLRRLEAVPGWVDKEMLTEGDRVSLLVPPRWTTLAFAGGSLSHTYSSPGIARLLVHTGQLEKMAPRRLVETAVWKANVILPGGLVCGAPGYVQTAQVRLLHARVRASALRHGWDTARWGVPINQTDVARTWLDFTLVPFGFLAAAGFVLDEEEQRSLYRYWHYVGHLLGLDESFFLPVGDHADAAALLKLVDSTVEPPDDNSRALTAALFDATAAALAKAPGSTLTETGACDLLDALARSHHGDERADALGIPRSPVTDVLPFLAAANAQARRYQTLPEAAAQERAANIRQFRALAGSLPDHTAYQKHATPPSSDQTNTPWRQP